jgi:hypothetical protein
MARGVGKRAVISPNHAATAKKENTKWPCLTHS